MTIQIIKKHVQMLYIRTLTPELLTSKDMHDSTIVKIKQILREYFHLDPKSTKLIIDSNHNGGDCIALDVSRILPFKEVIVNRDTKTLDNTNIQILSTLHNREWNNQLKDSRIQKLNTIPSVKNANYVIGLTTGNYDQNLLTDIENHTGYGIILNLVTGCVTEYPPNLDKCLNMSIKSMNFGGMC